MRSKKTGMILKINLSKNFIKSIKKTMEDELEIATKKWNIRLSEDERNNVIFHSINQLQQKVQAHTRLQWDLSDILTVKVNSIKEGEVIIPDKSLKGPKIPSLIKTKDGWTVDDEDRDQAIHLSKFHTYFQDLMHTWARTAVFYGVGSYIGLDR